MKEKMPFFILLLLLTTFFFGKEIFYNYLLEKDSTLKSSVIIENDYQNLKKEYETLLEKEELLKEREKDSILSRVVIKDPYYFFDRITILKGSEENIAVGDIIYNETGYIGKVTKTNKHSSEVELITNKNTVLSVQINNCYGTLKKEGENLIVKNITSKEEIKEQDIVYTSSFSNIGIELPVAVVEKVNSTMIEQTLVVKPLISLEKLNYILIRKMKNYD